MPTASRVTLSARPTGGGIVFGGFQGSNLPVSSEIAVGNHVYLRDGTVSIVVRVTRLELPQISGEVIGFDDWDPEAFKGLRPGSSITFREEHVFACST